MALTMNDIYEILRNEGGRTPSEKVMEVSKDHPEKIAMRYKEFGIWQETTYKDFWLKSNYVSMALRFFGVVVFCRYRHSIYWWCECRSLSNKPCR
jgi:long-subunit acyl-CoA synthetase (AMP-forming)